MQHCEVAPAELVVVVATSRCCLPLLQPLGWAQRHTASGYTCLEALADGKHLLAFALAAPDWIGAEADSIRLLLPGGSLGSLFL
mmetsp:Transcript_67172/g.129878  ORF Transcript_67172/g.129878 Transcript_67172/m.129878 type:complete len:84 (+) Transcript_67172:281-532(+)